ncbi:arginine--tRNA ligase, partial [Candidatus Woesebacteria bacterium]|nr:arginine--tRNA ligase [Candidatus Woesebacteria bacterium]
MVRDKIVKALQKATGETEASLEIPENSEHGDYSTNVAMILAKKLKKGPRELASEIKEKILRDKDIKRLCEKVEIAGPARLPAGQGFINFWLKKEVLQDNLASVLKEKDKYGSSTVGRGKTVLVEYSSPNIAKRFGIGHLRSTIIGQAIYNLYQFLGYKTIGENHLGDWGTQFGAILRQISNDKLQMTNLTIDELEKLYVNFNKEAEGKPELWEEARSWFKKLEAGDKKAREIWEKVREISLAEFERVYTRLGVKIDHAHGESFYEDKMGSIVKEFRDKGLSKKSQGAEIVELADLPPAMLVKSDGATTYFARDLAALKFRLEKWHPEAIIYEVGSDQILHFKQVFASASAIGWVKNQRLIHIAHGLIRFGEGKMST